MGDLVWHSLVLIGLVGGIGIAALGPGGVIVTIGLFALTDLSPSAVAGTAIVTHVATGLMGTAVYLRSGQLRDPATRRMSTVLAVLGQSPARWRACSSTRCSRADTSDRCSGASSRSSPFSCCIGIAMTAGSHAPADRLERAHVARFPCSSLWASESPSSAGCSVSAVR